jgi:hypothetical protein
MAVGFLVISNSVVGVTSNYMISDLGGKSVGVTIQKH